jgi:hypothetical protein
MKLWYGFFGNITVDHQHIPIEPIRGKIVRGEPDVGRCVFGKAKEEDKFSFSYISKRKPKDLTLIEKAELL